MGLRRISDRLPHEPTSMLDRAGLDCPASTRLSLALHHDAWPDLILIRSHVHPDGFIDVQVIHAAGRRRFCFRRNELVHGVCAGKSDRRQRQARPYELPQPDRTINIELGLTVLSLTTT